MKLLVNIFGQNEKGACVTNSGPSGFLGICGEKIIILGELWSTGSRVASRKFWGFMESCPKVKKK